MSFVRLGVVIPRGAGGQFDDKYVYCPAALRLDGRIYLYYVGFNGSRDRIGLATSEDGVHFTKQGVVLPEGAAGEFDVLGTFAPGVLVLDGRIYLYYVSGPRCIGLAISEDGVRFTKLGVVLPRGGGGEFDDTESYYPCPLFLDGRVYLYYSGHDGSNYRIGLAVSEDGIYFTKLGVVLPLGDAGQFDDVLVYASAALSLNGRVHLYYTGWDAGKPRIGLAISEDGMRFTKMGIMLPFGAPGDFDDYALYFVSALFFDGRVYLYYGAKDGGDPQIGLAISEEGI